MRVPGGSPLLSTPGRENAVRRTRAVLPLVPSSLSLSASHSTDPGFELGGEYLDVFLRAAERVAGLCVGCLAVAALWMISPVL